MARKSKLLYVRNFTKPLLQNEKEILLNNLAKEKYQRVLATVTIDGVDLVDILVARGFGRKWIIHSVDWCDSELNV